MNLRQLESFVRVAELRSFSKASMVLGIAQPSLSRQVRALETDLRETLLLRNGRGVNLTDAGRRFFEHCVNILQSVDLAREELITGRGQPTGRVAIGIPPSIGLRLTLPLIDRFSSNWPSAKLAVVEGMSTHIVEWIASGRIDLALVFNPEPNAAIETRPLLEEELCLVSPKRQEAGLRYGPLTLADLQEVPLVVPDGSHAIRKLLDKQAALSGVRLDIAWEVSSVPTILAMVRAGYGHGVLTASGVLAAKCASELTLSPLKGTGLTSVLCLATPAHKKPTPLGRVTAQLIDELIAEQSHGSAAALTEASLI